MQKSKTAMLNTVLMAVPNSVWTQLSTTSRTQVQDQEMDNKTVS